MFSVSRITTGSIGIGDVYDTEAQCLVYLKRKE